ncbi:MAG: hypothetical protein ACI83E_001082, partial [Sulfitobacter sp.]
MMMNVTGGGVRPPARQPNFIRFRFPNVVALIRTVS